MATTKVKAPAKAKTATNTKKVANGKTATATKAPAKVKPTAKTGQAKKPAAKKTGQATGQAPQVVLPFQGADSPKVKMNNGQEIRKSELPMISGMLRLEIENGRQYSQKVSGVTIAQALLNTKKTGNNLMAELAAFNTKNVLATA
jgi:hypothetical protein